MKRNLFQYILAIIAVLIIAAPLMSQDKNLNVKNLRTEYKVNPLGIDNISPRHSWVITSKDRGIVQTSYQVHAATDLKSLASGKNLIWDSGKVESGQSIHILYQGPSPESGQRIYWKVRVWDNERNLSGWSSPAWWETGLLNTSDWKASWIQADIDEDIKKSEPCPMLRREFSINKKIVSARAYVTSLGLYELEINGQNIGNEVFTPGWTSYNKRLQYQTFDVTDKINRGENAIGITLGDGWYRGFFAWNKKRNTYGEKLALLLQINIEFEDGSKETVCSDKSWKSATGPILKSDIYNGELYDARLEKNGWSKSGFKDSDLSKVKVINHSKDILTAPQGPPVKRMQEIKPVKILKSPNGKTIVDMGQNMVGRIRMRVKGKAGTTISLRHVEVLDKEGNIYIDNLRAAKQTVEYILKGGGEEIYEPHFTFQGFRYVQIDGFPGELALDSITGIVIYSEMPLTGDFECSNAMINQLQKNIQWGQKGNFLDVPTDCPQRDERMGWTGDAQVFARTACFNMDAASFFTKWLGDVDADQKKDGSVPWVVPDVLNSGGSAAWADAAVIVPWTVYLCFGDKSILRQQYKSMKAWVEYMRKQSGDRFLWNTGFHFGDWLAFNTTRSDYPGATTDKDLIATAFFAHSTDLLQKIASILGKNEDAKVYRNLFMNIKKAFQKEFVTANGRLSSNTQTAYSLALAFDLIPEELKKTTAKRLADDVRSFKHITTGFVGTPLICHVLSDYGYNDLAYLLLNRKEYPSWLYPITKGATTIWERWDGIKPNGDFQNAGMNSFNHYAYGAIGDWLYRVVGGIEIDENNPGYKHILIQPKPGGDLTYARTSLSSIHGQIESFWEIKEGKFNIEILIPANTGASITLPNTKINLVTEKGKQLNEAKGITKYYSKGQNLIVEAGSGKYNISYVWDN